MGEILDMKNRMVLGIITVMLVASTILTGCRDNTKAESQAVEEEIVQEETGVAKEAEELPTVDEVPEAEIEEVSEVVSKTLPQIVWLGDSLTQGSLGDNNENVNNPQAPWRVLGEKYKLDVVGYGYYAYVAHDIFWRYGEDGGIKDPGKIYVFWVGANDFTESAANLATVIDEIDRFVTAGGIDKFMVLGTTNREIISPEDLKLINNGFENHYPNQYLDIVEYVEFGPDGTHLTPASYERIADAVYDELCRRF